MPAKRAPDAVAPPTVYGQTDLDYNDYLKVPELLDLQRPLSKPPHHDEMLFIIIHQAYELWFKLLLHEAGSALKLLERDDAAEANHRVQRMVQVGRLLVQQIHLLETMRPIDFLQFRDELKPASGFQSLQFREFEFRLGLKDPVYFRFFQSRPALLARLKARMEEPDVRGAFYDLLRRQGFDIPPDANEREREGDAAATQAVEKALQPIYEDPKGHAALYALCESLMDVDEGLQLWREHHVRVVERIIGHKRGTGGSSGVEYLRSTTGKRVFPALWGVRTRIGGGE